MLNNPLKGATGLLHLIVCGLVAFLPSLVRAQPIPPVGTASTFDLATWNIEWFGAVGGPFDDEQQFRNVLNVMRAADVDLWALQEIADEADFARLLDSLGTAYGGYLATESSQQRIAFVYKHEGFAFRNVRHIFSGLPDPDPFATRPPLQLEADITIADSTRRLTFITVHMKCCGAPEEYERRRTAARLLKNRIDFTALTGEPVVILGDFNDELGASIASGNDTPYRDFIDDPTRYQFLTQPLDDGNVSTYCSNSSCTFGSTLDHILITNELFTDFEYGSAGRYIELTSAIPGYVGNTSDHLPVFARMRYGISTSVDVPEPSVRIGEPFPNPVSGDLVVPGAGGAACDACTVFIVDVLGRKVNPPLDNVASDIAIDTRGLAGGLYFAVVSVNGDTIVRRFVVVR